MKIVFKQSGESPEFGTFIEGEERDLPDDIAKTLVGRCVAGLPPSPASHKPALSRAEGPHSSHKED